MIAKIKGTNDILPQSVGEGIFVSQKWQELEAAIRKIAENFRYEEIRTPAFEYTELFVRGLGDVTDIVQKEMFTFVDRGDRSLTLRPEGTASVVRSLIENALHRKQNVNKLYYIGPMFRAERPQKGRYRQFHQCGVECLGSDSPLMDVEVMLIFWQLFRSLGLSGLNLVINSVGCAECRPNYQAELQSYFSDKLDRLCSDCNDRYGRNVLRMLDCKNERCQSILDDAPPIEGNLCESCSSSFDAVRRTLDMLEVPYTVSARLVRGLDYYTKTAFEIIHNGIGAQGTIAGGGRYDGLVEAAGGNALPAVGAAFGMERLLLAMEAEGVNQRLHHGVDFYVVALDETRGAESFKFLNELRCAGFCAEMGEPGRALGKQLKVAAKVDARFALFTGGAEWNEGTLVVKDLAAQQQREISVEGDYLEELAAMLQA